MAKLPTLETAPTLKELAYRSIKKAIQDRLFQPGILFNEQTLAKQLGISKTPVREALLELSSRGLVIFLPRKGFEIIDIKKKDIRDLFELRMPLELAVIRHIAPTISDASCSHIESIHKKEKQCVENGTIEDLISIDRQYHGYLSSLTENKYLISSLDRIRDLIELVGTWSLHYKGPETRPLKEHRSISDMLVKRNIKGALEMMKQHIEITEHETLANMPVTDE